MLASMQTWWVESSWLHPLFHREETPLATEHRATWRRWVLAIIVFMGLTIPELVTLAHAGTRTIPFDPALTDHGAGFVIASFWGFGAFALARLILGYRLLTPWLWVIFVIPGWVYLQILLERTSTP